jgi:alpha/beta superfamily hydrolase
MPDAVFLMAAGLSTQWENDHLEDCSVRKIFVHSTRDEFAPRAEFEAVFAKAAEPKQLIWIDAADHFFAGALDGLEAAVRTAAGELRSSDGSGAAQ